MNIIYGNDFKDYTAKYWFVINNILLFVGVVFLGWNPYSVIAAYFLDTLIVGFFNIIKMAVIIFYRGAQSDKDRKYNRPGLIIFFIFHYGFFVLIQILLFTGFASSTDPNFPVKGFFPNPVEFFTVTLDIEGRELLLSFVLGHAISFIRNFIMKNQYRETTATVQMILPYPRIVVQQVVVVIGAFIMVATKSPLTAPILLIIMKTIVDIALEKYDIHTLLEEKIREKK